MWKVKCFKDITSFSPYDITQCQDHHLHLQIRKPRLNKILQPAQKVKEVVTRNKQDFSLNILTPVVTPLIDCISS